ncbi:unnamed protein product [Amoebophrya sp. A120]|nr:unnamed protein product [Amoebophrya sp. A120]|eukprot:GSA120T00008562001.1
MKFDILNLAFAFLFDRETNGDLPFYARFVESLSTLSDAFRLFGFEKTYSSFNGGKEATVLLYLMLMVLDERYEVFKSGGTILDEKNTSATSIKAAGQQEKEKRDSVASTAASSAATPNIISRAARSASFPPTTTSAQQVQEQLTGSTVASSSSTSSTPEGALAQPPFTNQIRAVHFVQQNDSEFPEILKFVKQCDTYFGTNHLKVLALEEVQTGWKDGIESLLNRHTIIEAAESGTTTTSLNKQHKQLICFALGTRKTDPNAGARPEKFEPSSTWLKGLDFFRCNPILDWEYQDVWTFLRDFQLPYCELYDRGYTSIGTVKDSEPNPHLKIDNGDAAGAGVVVEGQSEYYLPAWELKDPSLERLGRTKKK